jgi:aminoglycoside phosphotransferase (APT) family kinase protein
VTGPADDDLRAVLEPSLRARFGDGRPVAIERRPCPYQTSFRLEELDVAMEDGTRLELMFKDLGPVGLSPGARAAKPDFLYDPSREVHVYSRLLESSLGTAICYGAVADAEQGRYWLFLERIAGMPLWQSGELRVWEEVARWLARLHLRFSSDDRWRYEAGPLVEYGADFFRVWPKRAVSFTRARGAEPAALQALERIAAAYEPLAERLAALPRTFIHGEFYASNVLVSDATEDRPEARSGLRRVCPIDWENAAVGPPLVDVAALVTGKGWGASQRDALTAAYRDELDKGGEAAGNAIDSVPFEQTLECCRLHLALQWLGWAPDWTPPAEHRQDWLDIALGTASRLGLA